MDTPTLTDKDCAEPVADQSRTGATGPEALPATIGERLRRGAARPDIEGFLTLLHADRDDERFSYRTVLRKAERFAAYYQACGLAPGDRVVIVLRHSLDLYASFVGALLGGFVPAMWSFPSPKISEEEYFKALGLLLRSAEPKLLLTYPTLRDRLVENPFPAGFKPPPNGPTRVIGADEVPVECKPSKAPIAIDPEHAAFLQYSSGTTGIKKGVAISHRALLFQVDSYADAINLGSEDRIVTWLPLYHDMGLIACLLLPFVHRVPIVAMCPFAWVQRPATWVRAVSDFGGTLSWLPNFAYTFLANNVTTTELAGQGLSSLRGVVNCSEPILAASHEAFLRRFRVAGLRDSALCASYALAENTFAVTSGGFDQPLRSEHVDGKVLAGSGRAVVVEPTLPHARLLVSSGSALPETDIQIVDDEGRPLPERHLGEIVLRSPCLLSAYDRNEEATRATVRCGACFTGDVGYLANGALYVTGRKKDMLIIRGQNIYPQDIEALVNDTPGVIPGRTAAISVPNEQTGTEDLVILAESHETEPDPQEALGREIFRRVSQATEITPADIRLLEHRWLRKSTSGKISRAINRDRYLALIAGEPLQRDSHLVPQNETLERDSHLVPRSGWPTSFRGGGHDDPQAQDSRAADSTLVEVRQCVEQHLSQTVRGRAITIRDDEPLITSGVIDSLGLAALIHALEDRCRVSFPPQALMNTGDIDTLLRMAEHVERLREGGFPGEEPDTFPRCREDVPLSIGCGSTGFQPVASTGYKPVPHLGDPRAHRRIRGFWSRYYYWLLRRRGVHVGRGLRVLGRLILRFDGDPRNIRIGNNVTLMPGVDLKIRENGKLIFHDGVVLDTNVRLVAANDARLELGEDAQVGMGTVINAGADVIVGRRTAIAGMSLIAASEHNYLARTPFMEQGYRHDPVYIGEDVWAAFNVFIGRGSRIGNGTVLGVKSVVRGDFPAYSVVMGDPARVVRFRG